MRKRTERHQGAADRMMKDIRSQTRKRYFAEEKIRIMLAGLRDEDSIAELCRHPGDGMLQVLINRIQTMLSPAHCFLYTYWTSLELMKL